MVSGTGTMGYAKRSVKRRPRALHGKEWRKDVTALRTGLVLGCTGRKNELTALVDSDDIHCLIGASGVGEAAFFLYPNLEYACASGGVFWRWIPKRPRPKLRTIAEVLRLHRVGHRPA